jgi:hypothetical protein
MKLFFCIAAATMCLIRVPTMVFAQDRILVIQVVDTRDRPIAGVVLSTKGEGAVGQPTDISGKTRIKLAPQTRPGTLVSLLLVKVMDGRDLVFNSPWDGRARVPPFESESENFVPVVLIARGERERLVSVSALKDSLVTSLPRRELRNRAKKNGGVPAKKTTEAGKQTEDQHPKSGPAQR